MKQLITLIALLFMLNNMTSANAQGFQKSIQETSILSRAMAPGDPNLDPNWDWTVDISYDLYGIVNQGIAYYPGQKLPYFTLSGSTSGLNVGESADNYRDFRRSDGWILLHRDFGTPTSAPNVIHYVLYNRYRGVMRVFYFNNILQGTYQYAFVKLSFEPGTPKTGILGSEDENPFLDSYNPNVIQTAVSSNVENNPAWCYADFDVSMYDDLVSGKTDATLKFIIEGIQTSAMKLAGSQTLQGVMEDGSLSASTKSSTSIMDHYNVGNKLYHKGKKWYKGSEKLAVKLGQLALPAYDPNKDWYRNMAAISLALPNATAIMKGVQFASAAAGFVKSFLGFGKNKAAALPMSYRVDLEGELELTGQISVSAIGASFGFRVPGTPHTDPAGNSVLPLNDALLGVFSIRTKPTIEFNYYNLRHLSSDCTNEPYSYCLEEYETSWSFALKQPLDYVFNSSSSGCRLVSVEASFVAPEINILSERGALGYMNQSQLPNVMFTRGTYSFSTIDTDPTIDGEIIVAYVPSQISVRVKYVPNDSPTDTLYMIKVFPANKVYNSNLSKAIYGHYGAPVVGIYGPYSINTNQTGNWSANVTDGVAPFSYTWFKNGVQVGSGQSVSCSSASNFILSVNVTDAYGQTASSTLPVYVVPMQTVTISGPSWVKKGLSGNWTANVSGGVSPFTYKWFQNGSQIGTSQSVMRTGTPPGFTLRVDVTGANGVMVSTSRYIQSSLIPLEKSLDENAIPEVFELKANFPNPFNPSTTIQYGLKENTQVVLKIYNLLGQEVRNLVNETQSAGYKTVLWDGKNNAGTQVPSGIYIYKLEAGSFTSSKKMLLVK
ncbi:T9SS type A sorting domain-containing protein [bacterium]|nr:T9SS type A sorting domain-containing protein [bacterium]